MQIYLSVTSGEAEHASKYPCRLAYVAYRIGTNSTLLRQNPFPQIRRGGLLSVSDRNSPPIDQPNCLCEAILRELGRWNYSGVVLDFEEPPQQDRLTFITKLSQLLAARHKTLYLPESYAQASKSAIIFICTALSGGNLAEYLQSCINRYGGANRLALDIERLRMDFQLPARSGMGTPLTRETFCKLLEQETPSTFFSQELCARYFTYTQNKNFHFVLFDDADTLNRKLRLGRNLGFHTAFFTWPEIHDIAENLGF